MNPKVYDCFTFFNELDLLELRFRELYDDVDYFVVCESELTFTGNSKPLHFQENRERFKPFLNKVIHVIVNDFPETSDPWVREYFQRDALRRGFRTADADDLIIITDVDEILNKRAVRESRSLGGYIQFNMSMYQFYMNLRAGKNDWMAPFAFRFRDQSKIPDFSRARWVKTEIHAAFPNAVHLIDDAGWHFTHLGGIQRIHQKFKSFSHAKDPWPQAMLQAGALEKQIITGGRVGENKSLSEFVPIDDSFPATVIERLGDYEKLGFIADPYKVLAGLQREYQSLRVAYAVQVYDDKCEHPALGNITGEAFLKLAGLAENPYQGKVFKLPEPHGELLSREKMATQSSVSEWSRVKVPELDATGALDGKITGHGKFHTLAEDNPWWMVDLDEVCEITEIRIYNRILPKFPDDAIAARAARLKIEGGKSVNAFEEFFRKEDSRPFGGIDGRPLILRMGGPRPARYIRITLLSKNPMHFDQVEIYGRKSETIVL